MTLLSLAVAIVLIGLFLPAFNQITGKDLTFSFTLPVFQPLLLSALLQRSSQEVILHFIFLVLSPL
jgi:hypothetical protein